MVDFEDSGKLDSKKEKVKRGSVTDYIRPVL
jgi:hypothetical protein